MCNLLLQSIMLVTVPKPAYSRRRDQVNLLLREVPEDSDPDESAESGNESEMQDTSLKDLFRSFSILVGYYLAALEHKNDMKALF
jgi:hypothetical protein